MHRVWLPVALSVVLGGGALARGDAAPSEKPAVERRARAVERLLTAPCCYKGTLEDHASAVATQMRQEIRAFLQSGKTQKQILDHYRNKYGQAVLVEPPQGGLSGFVLYGIPFGLAVLGLVIMTALMARRKIEDPGAKDGVAGVPDRLSPAMEARIDALVAGQEARRS